MFGPSAAHNACMSEPLPPLELLEERHDFPCRYTFKVIGEADEAFERNVARCVQDELQLEDAPSTSVKSTAGGRHQSITVDPMCPDGESVLRLYRALRTVPGVLFLF